MRASPRYQRGFWSLLAPALGSVAKWWLGSSLGGAAATGITAAAAAKDIHDSRQDRKFALGRQDAAMAQNERLQREFASQGIQMRVADAKAAGIHPLYALQGGGAAFAPGPIPAMDGDSGVSQNLGRAFEANSARREKMLQQELIAAQIRNADASSEENLAQAQYWRSEAARRAVPTPGVPPHAIEVKPSEQLTTHGARGPGFTPATQPALERVMTPDGPVDLFSPIQLDERLGEMGQALALPYLIGHNVRGPLREFFEGVWPIHSGMLGDRIVKRDRNAEARAGWSKRYPGVRFPSGWDFNPRR